MDSLEEFYKTFQDKLEKLETISTELINLSNSNRLEEKNMKEKIECIEKELQGIDKIINEIIQKNSNTMSIMQRSGGKCLRR